MANVKIHALSVAILGIVAHAALADPIMPVDAFISTSDRTILSYLISPLADQMRRTFREN